MREKYLYWELFLEAYELLLLLFDTWKHIAACKMINFGIKYYKKVDMPLMKPTIIHNVPDMNWKAEKEILKSCREFKFYDLF